jgi:putative endonuclease
MERELPNRRHDGEAFEERARIYLQEKGYVFITSNFRWGKAGEIDLVMRDGDVYVFVEVKMRRTHEYGTPEDAITESKRKTLRRIADGYVYVNNIVEIEGRFDVVAFDYADGSDGEPEIRHHVDAFR